MFRDLNSLSGKVIRTKRAASCTSDNLKAVTSLGPPCFSKPIKIQGESSSMVKSTSWLWEERHVYINRWRATRRRSIHLSGKVANLSEMSIALILQFGSGSMLSTEEEEKKSWTPCLFNTLNQLPIFRPDWIHFFFPPVLQFNQIMGPGQVLQPFCFFKRIEQLIFSFLITRSKCNGRCFSWMSSVLALDRGVQSGHDSLSFAPPLVDKMNFKKWVSSRCRGARRGRWGSSIQVKHGNVLPREASSETKKIAQTFSNTCGKCPQPPFAS